VNARRWFLVLDCFWAVLLVVAVVAWLAGRVEWYKAALALAPFSMHLCIRSMLRPCRASS